MNDMTIASPVGEIDRRTYIGGSDAAAIMGLGAYGKTPLSVYLTKIGESPDELDAERQRFLDRRKRWEGPIVEMLREEFDCEITAINQRYVDQEYDFIAGEIDFEWRDPETGLIENGEIKTVSPFAFGENKGWGEAGTDEIPVHYAAQAMHNLGIMNRNVCIVAAMVGLDSMIFYRIHRDDETIAEMRARCVHFWHEHVLKRNPPAPLSLADVMSLTLKMRGKPIEADADMLKNIRDLETVRGRIKAFEGDKEEIMFKIGGAILKAWQTSGTSDAGTDTAIINHGGQKVATWGLQTTTRLKSAELKAAKPEIYNEFSKTTASRVLRISKPK